MSDDDFGKRRFEQIFGAQLRFQLGALTDPNALAELEAYTAGRSPEQDELDFLLLDHKYAFPACKYLLGRLPAEYHSDLKPVIEEARNKLKDGEKLGIIDREPNLFDAKRKLDEDRERLKDFDIGELAKKEVKIYRDRELYRLTYSVLGSNLNLDWFNIHEYEQERAKLEGKVLPLFYGVEDIRRSSPAQIDFTASYTELFLRDLPPELAIQDQKPIYMAIPFLKLEGKTVYLLNDTNFNGRVELVVDCGLDQVVIGYSSPEQDNIYSVLLENGLDRKVGFDFIIS